MKKIRGSASLALALVLNLGVLGSFLGPVEVESVIFQSIDRSFEGDDPSEWFPLTAVFDPAIPEFVN